MSARRIARPVGGIWLGAILSIAATLYSPAFTALAAGCAMFIYISYALASGATAVLGRQVMDSVPSNPS